jgi:Domain of unknown function (DUF4386)
VAPEAQTEWEARAAKPAAAAAFGSVAFSLVAIVIRIAGIGSGPEDEREFLLRFADDRTYLIVSIAAQAISFLLLAGALFYLLRATGHRRPETPRFVMPLLVIGPVLLTIGAVINNIALADVADEFVSSGARTNARAEDLLEGNVVGGSLQAGGVLCVALSFVLVSLNAMRAGLLSRFMGILGIIVGVLYVLPLLPGGQSFVQLFWLGALGVLFLGHWPGGRGPAWETGEAIEWPNPRRRQVDEEPMAGALPPTDPRDPPPAADGDEPASRKRKKRKRR